MAPMTAQIAPKNRRALLCRIDLALTITAEPDERGVGSTHFDRGQSQDSQDCARTLVIDLNVANWATRCCLRKGAVDTTKYFCSRLLAERVLRSDDRALGRALALYCKELLGIPLNRRVGAAEFSSLLKNKTDLLAGIDDLQIFGDNLEGAVGRTFHLSSINFSVPGTP